MKIFIPRRYRKNFRKPFVPAPPPDLAGFGMIDPLAPGEYFTLGAEPVQYGGDAPSEFIEIHDKNLEDALAWSPTS